jgi:hypothetical protein
MAFYDEVDTRLADADRLADEFRRRNAHEESVTALLPALLSEDERVRRSAEEWINDNALVGMIGDPSDPETQRASAELALDAEQYARSLGVTASDIPGFRERFQPTEAQIDSALNERLPVHMRAGYSTATGLHGAESRAETSLSRPHGRRPRRDTIDLANGPESAADDYWGSGVSRPFFINEE